MASQYVVEEERRDLFCVLQKLPPKTKGGEAEQGPQEAAAGTAAGAEDSAGGDGGPAGEQVRVVVSPPFARHARLVVLRPWNLLGLFCAFCVCYVLYSFVYDVNDKLGASTGPEKNPCFYKATVGFGGSPTRSRMSFHAVHPFSRREALCMLPLPLLASFSALYRWRLLAAFSVFRYRASVCASGGMFASCAAFYSPSRFI